MFAVELIPQHKDLVLETRYFFTNQPSFKIGNQEECALRLAGLEGLDFTIQVVKKEGATFTCRQVFVQVANVNQGFFDEYENTAKLHLGSLKLIITSIDSDLRVREGEAPDTAGYRLLKQALVQASPEWPALVFEQPWSAVVSFNANDVLSIGRADDHHIVVKSPDISSDHARFGFHQGRYWVEDLGSTNGTFVNGQQVSGKIAFSPGEAVFLGATVKIIGAIDRLSQTQTASASQPTAEFKINEILTPNIATDVSKGADKLQPVIPNIPIRSDKYPKLVTLSKLARPAHLVIKPGQTISIGRDPNSDLWLGAPYVSRIHNQIFLDDLGNLHIKDSSSNGTAYSSGTIQTGSELVLRNESEILHYGSGLAVAICFNEEDEHLFIRNAGRADAFLNKGESTLNSLSIEEQGNRIQATSKNYQKISNSTGNLSVIEFFLNLEGKYKLLIAFFALLFVAIIVLLVSIVFTFL